ncbi:MAG: hypothetical protein K0Q49_1432 [Haloplasmataceae bacterium]|nr:hypothetical protein [Haloplasmataceae bacterium]
MILPQTNICVKWELLPPFTSTSMLHSVKINSKIIKKTISKWISFENKINVLRIVEHDELF